MRRNLNILLLLFVCLGNVYAEHLYSNSKKLEDELYIYDSKYQKLVPLINENVNTIHFTLDTKLYKGQFIQFMPNATIVIFVNNQLFKKITSKEHVAIPIDEIRAAFGGGSLLLTMYSPQKLRKTISTLGICTPKNDLLEPRDTYRMIERLHFVANQSVLLGVLLLFVFFFAIQNGLSPSLFEYVYNPVNLFRDITGDDLSTMSRIDPSKIIFVLLDSIMISFAYLVLHTDDWNEGLLQKIFSLNIYMVMLLFLKYIYNQIVAYVFRLSNHSHVQYFQFLRHSMVFALMSLVGYLVFCSPFTIASLSGRDIFNVILVVLLFSYITKVIFSLKKVINLRSFYFISYICVSELIPVILFLVYYFSRIDRGIS